MTDEVREQSARLYFVDHSPVDEAERELAALLRLLDAERAKVARVEALCERANGSAGLNFSVSTAALRFALANLEEPADA